MTNFRVDLGAAFAAFSVLVMFVPSVRAMERAISVQVGQTAPVAQEEKPAPRRLLPRRSVLPEPAPEDSKGPAAPVGPTDENAAEGKARSGIEINRLSGPNPEDIGTVGEQNGGLSRTFWAGTPAALAARLLRNLPKTVMSPTIRDLVRRLLLTAAIPPNLEEGGEMPNLVAQRVIKLQEMGYLGSASALLEIAPQRDRDADLIRLNADNLLLRGDVNGACEEARRQDVRLEELFWQQLLILCQAAEGNLAEATLGASLLAESGVASDPVFDVLVDGLTSGGPPKTDPIDASTPLQIAILRHAKVPISEESLAQASPALLAAVIADADMDLDSRLKVAERSARSGTMSSERLRSVYADARFSGEELENALSIAEAARSPRGRALLFQAAIAQDVPTARAEVLQKALVLAREDGVYALAIHLYRSMLEGLTPSAELSWFAGDAAHALFALGRTDLARLWVLELRYAMARDPSAKIVSDLLWALALLAQNPETAELPIGTAEAWRAAVTERMPERAQLIIPNAMALLEYQDAYWDRDGWRALLGEGENHMVRMPNHAYRAALSAATLAGRVGEVILLSAALLGESELADLELTVLSEIVTALKQTGFVDEARALIVEVAVEKGL